MRVKDLIEELKKCDEKVTVFISDEKLRLHDDGIYILQEKEYGNFIIIGCKIKGDDNEYN